MLGAMSRTQHVTVREAGAADFDTWFGLYEAVAAEGRWIGGELPVDRDRRREHFLTGVASPNEVCFVADVDGVAVATLNASVRGGIVSLGMLVDDRHRGQGVGSALMDAAVSWAKTTGAHKMTLEVWPHNAAARALYRKFGFRDEGRLRRHYRRRNGELWDAVVMGRVLDESSAGSPYDEIETSS
jgi:RimJ/RimL family protein N-acetyltransferase